MRTALASLIVAAGLSGAALAQAPASTTTTTTTAPPQPAAALPVAPAPAPAAAPATTTTTTTTATAPAAAAPGVASPAPAAATPAPAAPAEAAAEPAPTLPTTGDGAVVISALERICVPLVRGGNLDDLAKAFGMKKNRRDLTWTGPLGGDKNYTLTILPPGSNRDVCRGEVHYALGQDKPIVSAINVWSFLHQPELILQANYVAVDPDGVKRVRKSWEALLSSSSTAVNFSTLSKPDGSSMNRNYDVGELYYQERKF